MTTTKSSDVIRRPSVTDERISDLFSGFIEKDFLRLMCGRFIGGGVGRGVYECAVNEDLVIKVETVSYSFQNVMEWQVWQEVKDNDTLSEFFAPCHSISPCGAILAMYRTLRPDPQEWEDRMPAFLSDFKRDNFGMYEDRLVCHDYGINKMLISGTSARLINADWRD